MNKQNKIMKKINVIGTSGSGKSHFSRQLAQKLCLNYIEMDAVFWLPNWQHLQMDEFLSKLETLMQQESWVLDGNQSASNALKWQYVDTIIWLDLGFFRTLKQILTRSFIRACSRQEIWVGTGNCESFKRNFFSSESVILWMLKNYWKTKKKYKELFDSELAENIQMIHLRSQEQAEIFLDQLATIDDSNSAIRKGY